MLPAPSTNPGAVARPTCTTTRHDANDYHNGRCRCQTGRTAHRRQYKLRQQGLAPAKFVSNVGTRRRVEGLMAMGWTGAQIAAAAGLARSTAPSQIAGDSRSPRVTVETAQAVRRAVAKLGGAPGPSNFTRGQARRLGYIPLWAWDDDIDDPAAKPQGTLPRPRRRQGMARLTAADLARFEQYRQPVGACARWTGCVDEAGRGKLALHGAGRSTTVRARRVAYWLHTGRDAAGEVWTSCGNSWCCAGPHMVDGAQVRKAAA